MENHLSRVYRKSSQGVAEVKTRASGLTLRARTALILVNGLDSVAALQVKMGLNASAILEELAAQGHIETMPSNMAAALVQPPPETTTPATVTLPAPLVLADAEVAARLSGLRREALFRLTQLFGPDVTLVAQALLKARTLDAFGAALPELEAKLHIYLGRKRAAALVAALRP
jgi:hypothetical protein